MKDWPRNDEIKAGLPISAARRGHMALFADEMQSELPSRPEHNEIARSGVEAFVVWLDTPAGRRFVRTAFPEAKWHIMPQRPQSYEEITHWIDQSNDEKTEDESVISIDRKVLLQLYLAVGFFAIFSACIAIAFVVSILF